MPLLLVKQVHALAGNRKGLFVGVSLTFNVLGELGEDVDSNWSGGRRR